MRGFPRIALGTSVVLGLLGFVLLDQFNALNIREWMYVRTNEQLLDDVPTYPGAREVARDSSAYSSADSGILYIRPDGWLTRAVIEVPSGTSEDAVLAFYIKEMGTDWQRSDLEIPTAGAMLTERGVESVPSSPVRILSFCRAGARVALDLDAMRHNGSFRLSADHASSGGHCR